MKNFLTLCFFIFIGHYSHAQLTAEQKKIQQTFFNFLKFYKKNESKFNSFTLYKGKGRDNNPPYTIQWKEVEKYFVYLRKNVPYVGEAYIKAERQHFKNSEKWFKEDPAEELPAGFISIESFRK